MPFIITLLAGCSTLIGYFSIYFKSKDDFILISSLSFASGVMFFISIFDLIPEAINILNKNYFITYSLIISITCLTFGIMLLNIFDRKYSSNYNNSKLYKIGIISMIAIIIHNIPEGIVTFLTSTNNMRLGIVLAIAVALHNIPEGISISVPIYYSSNSKKKAFLYTFISGISEFFGAIIAYLFLSKFNNDLFIGCMYSFTSGIMIYISLFELLPASLKYKRYNISICSFIFGIVFIYLSIFLLK